MKSIESFLSRLLPRVIWSMTKGTGDVDSILSIAKPIHWLDQELHLNVIRVQNHFSCLKQNCYLQWDMLAHTCEPTPEEAEAGGLRPAQSIKRVVG